VPLAALPHHRELQVTNISRGATPTSDPNESPPMTSQGNSSSLGVFTSPPVSYSAAVLGSGMQPPGATTSVFSSNSMFNVLASSLVAQGTNTSGASNLVPPVFPMMSPTNLPTNATTPLVIGGVVFYKLPVKTITRSSNALGKDRHCTMSQADLVKLRDQATSTLNPRVRIIQPLPDSFDDPKQLTLGCCIRKLCQPSQDIRYDGFFNVVFPDANGFTTASSTKYYY
jgi:hypothetical protein